MRSLLDLVPRRFMAAQLRRPSGLFGAVVLAPFLNHRNSTEFSAVLEASRLEPDDHVLEIGFGGGQLMAKMLPMLSRGHLSGVDFSGEMVGYCSRRFAHEIGAGLVDLAEAAAEDLPFGSSSFNKICTMNTVYFWDEPRPVAAELFRVLQPGGRLVVGFSPRAVLENVAVTRHGFTHYDPEEIEQLLLSVGFASVETQGGDGPRGEFVCVVALKR